MLISTKGRYALRVMLELASNSDPNTYMSLPAIAEKQEISEKYLESIISLLVKADMVEGIRGKGGGYRLKKPAEEYLVGDILVAAEGSLAPVSCIEPGKAHCNRKDVCKTRPLWIELNDIINDYLNTLTLKALLEKSSERI